MTVPVRPERETLEAICDKCGLATCAVWLTTDDLWLRFNGQEDGIACPDCFFRWAFANDLPIRFRVEPIAALAAAPDARLAEALREYVVAHTLVERGAINFDLHNEAVDRLMRAMEQPLVREIITETLVAAAREETRSGGDAT